MKYGMDGIGESVEGKQRQWRCLIAVTAILLVIAIGAVLVILLAVGGVIDLGECSRKVSGACNLCSLLLTKFGIFVCKINRYT